MSLQSVINADVDVDADAGVEYSTSGLQHHDSDLEDQPPNENQEQNWLTIRRRCELCKQRKVKCDRGQPSCGWCTRNGAICEYKERKKPGLRAGYGRELEQRLDRLEQVLRSHAQILESSFTNHSNSLPSDHDTPQSAPGFTSNDGSRGHVPHAETALFLQRPSTYPGSQSMDFANAMPQTPSMSSLHSDVFQQGMQQPNQQHNQSHPPPHPIQTTQAQDFYSTNQPPLASPSLNISQNQTEISSDHALPPYDLLYALVDLYFKHVNTWCPILHRRSTLDSLFGPSTLDEADRILLHAIVATTIRFSVDQRLTEDRRRHYHDISKQKVLLYGLENSSVKALQAMVILALDLVGSSNGPPGWNLLALLTRSVVQLGLAVETTSFSVSPLYPSIYTLRAMVLPESDNFIEEESRRRLFWMVYLLDRYATLATAFEFALDEKEIDRTLPCRDDLWSKNQAVQTRWFRTSERTEYDIDKPENLGAFSYYIEILGILSRIHKFHKKPVDISALSDVEQWQGEYRELDNMLTSWKFNLPGDYGNMAKLFQPGGSKSINCGWVMLHATYHTAVIRLHSSAAYPTTRSPIFTPSYSASQRCHGAVENVAALGEFVVQNGMLQKLGPPFAFTLWVAARLLLVHGSTIDHKLSPQIQFFVDSLREMGRYWLVAENYTSILQRVLDEHRDSERSAGANGERVTPSSVKILADMRRCAFDLDFLMSRQPKHVGMVPRMPSVTPARTPAPNELEYLDVFDFFNLPRLPVVSGNSDMNHITSNGDGNGYGTGNGSGNGVGEMVSQELSNGANEFNITNFMVDANSDWFKNQT
ncbi:putative transcriptional regulatory protein [Lachnellula hyalina]|uniref:Putative transcriptional regulatory protein n=1 Tax=Lachnellula hyalina TaxID=1316788 RepID=A0A8H8TY78_9HELO|nr:putative transcriptional regulatory protein [Lachnellula hyalina]TVY25090.1 putative transcriptional regulatory protein [Lachnellula hyalina]